MKIFFEQKLVENSECRLSCHVRDENKFCSAQNYFFRDSLNTAVHA
jgi:hypothetical protein